MLPVNLAVAVQKTKPGGGKAALSLQVFGLGWATTTTDPGP